MIRRDAREPFLVPGLISTSVTAMFGQPKCGKSALVVNLAVAAVQGKPFLGVPFSREVDRVIILTTDADGLGEYADRLHDAGAGDVGDRLTVWQLPTLTAEYIDAAATYWDLRPGAADLVVLDHVTALEADGNAAAEVARFTAALERFRGDAPLVMVGHASTSSVQGSSRRKLLGSTAWTVRIRWQVEVSRRAGGEVRLSCSGNSSKPTKFVLATGDHVTDFSVVSTTTGDEIEQAAVEKRRERDLETVQRVEDWARFVEQEAAGLTKVQQAEKLHERWPEVSVASFGRVLRPSGKIALTLARRREVEAA